MTWAVALFLSFNAFHKPTFLKEKLLMENNSTSYRLQTVYIEELKESTRPT